MAAAVIGIGMVPLVGGVGALIGGTGYLLNARTAARVAAQAREQHKQDVLRQAEVNRAELELAMARDQMRQFVVPASTSLNAFWYGWCYLLYKVCPGWHDEMELSWFSVDGVPMFNSPRRNAWMWIQKHPVFHIPRQALQELAADNTRVELYCDWHRYTGIPLLRNVAAIVKEHSHLARWPSVRYLESVFPSVSGLEWGEFTAGGVTAMLRGHFLAYVSEWVR